MSDFLHRANDDSAARLLLAEHAEECGDTRMARAWRWMACMAKWPDWDGWWPEENTRIRKPHRLPIRVTGRTPLFAPLNNDESEQALADALERGDL